MSVFQRLWLVICLLVPLAPQKPPEVAPASSPTPAPKSPHTSPLAFEPKPTPAPTSRIGKSGDLIIPVQTAQTKPSAKLEGLPTIAAFGDNLTAGYGLTEDQRFTRLLQRKIDEMGYRYRVENAGVRLMTENCGESLNHCC
jgi:hypothetical protein